MSALSTSELSSLLDARIECQQKSSHAPLTDMQENWWRVTSKDGRAENTRLRAASIRILGHLDVGILRASVAYVIQRHESLRTRILVKDGTPFQIVDPVPPQVLELIRLPSAPDTDHTAAENYAREFFAQKVDLSLGPLLAVSLLSISARSHVLLIGLEHVVADGTSCAILSNEIWAAYRQLSTGASKPVLPPLPIQLSDYAIWQKMTHPLRKNRHEQFWIDRTRDSPRIELPYKPIPRESESDASAILHLPLGKSLSDALLRAAQREGTPFQLLVLTVYLLSLSRWCTQNDFVIIFAHHGRYRRPELQNTIGYLAKALYFRIQVQEHETLHDLVARIHGEFVSIMIHQVFVPPLPTDCNLSFLFNWGGLSTYSARWSIEQQRKAVPDLRIQPFDFREKSAAVFFPFFSQTPSGVVLTIHFRPDIIPRDDLERLTRNMRFYAAQLVDDARVAVGSLDYIA